MVGVYSPACHTAARAEMRMRMPPSSLGPRDSNSAHTATVQGYDGQCAVSPRHHHLTDGTAATRFDRL
jgi:hypothetical protein